MLDEMANILLDSDVEAGGEKSSEPPPRHVKSTAYLDGLRGLAAFIVYLGHTVAWWYGPDTAFEQGFGYHGEYSFATLPFVRTMFNGGSAAVALFFVLSGYVLSIGPLHLLQQGNVEQIRPYLLAGALRRPFRLFLPVAALSLIFVATMHLPFGMAPELQWPKPEPTIWAELRKWIREMGRVMNMWDIHTTSTAWFPYNPPAWTMAAELKGSLCVFSLLGVTTLFVMSSLQRLWLFGFTGICLLLLCQWEIAAFMFGVSTAILDIDNRSLLPKSLTDMSPAITQTTLIAGLYLVGQPAGGKDPEKSSATPGWCYLTLLTPSSYLDHEFWRFWPVVGASMILLAITATPHLQHSLSRPIFRYLGRISFSFYLIHIPVTWVVGDRVARAFGKFRFDFDTPFDNILPIPDYGPIALSTGFWIWQASLVPVNLYVAWIVTKKIEEPTNRFGKWLVSGIRRSERT